MEISMSQYIIQKVLFSNGERLPMLIDSKSGIPDYWATLFSITRYRSKSLATNTIEQILRQLMLLNIFLNNEAIDLDERILHGKLLHLHEIENLCDLCKLYVKDITPTIKKTTSTKAPTSASLEKFRLNTSNKSINIVSPDTTGNRIRTIKDFLLWRANTHITKLDEHDIIFSILKESEELLKTNMISRIPKSSYGSQVNAPEGLSKEEITLLFETINRHSKTNPWKNTFTKIRNELLILWLYHFGARKGELLSLKISDINFKTQTFDLVRRADDSKDSRINQPLLKTRERRIAIPEKILTLTRDYIINHRSFLPQAKKHEFLFVASKSGLAMSLDSVNKIFSKLKETYPDSFIRLSPHILRHTWNDNFSSIMEKNNISEAEEKKIRSYLMGWSETSNSAETYTKRHTRQRGNEVILNMGNQLLNNFHLNNNDKI
jgi:integrase